MALLFLDSFDHYATADLTEKWTSGSGPAISAGNGRNSTSSLRTSGSGVMLRGLAPGSATAIVGLAVKFATLTVQNWFLGLWDGVNSRNQVLLVANSDGSLSVYRGGNASTPLNNASNTLLGSSAAGVIAAGTYYHLEVKWVLHDTTGSAEVRVNGVAVLTLTNVDTLNTGSGYSAVALGQQGTTGDQKDFDDFFVCDSTGASNNDFQGDCRVDAHVPSGAGNSADWTPSAGSNYQNVDDTAPNDDTDYNATSTLNAVDTYALQDLVNVGGTIKGLQVLASCRKTDAGTAMMAPVLRRGGTDYVGSDYAPSTAYAYHLRQCYDVDPSSSAAFTESNFNGMEVGIKKTA